MCDLARKRPNAHALSPRIRTWPVKVVNRSNSIVRTPLGPYQTVLSSEVVSNPSYWVGLSDGSHPPQSIRTSESAHNFSLCLGGCQATTRLRGCESHNLAASALVILCIWLVLCHSKARSYAKALCVVGLELRNKIIMGNIIKSGVQLMPRAKARPTWW